MKLSLLYFRTTALIIIFSLVTLISFSATIVSIASGNWSASAWPFTTIRPGTLTATVGSTAITGVGTAFLTNISVGNILYTTGNAIIGTVLSVNSNTSITLVANAAVGNANLAYHFQGVGPGDIASLAGGFTVTVDNASDSCASIISSNTGTAWDLVFSSGSHLKVGGTVAIGGTATHAGTIDMSAGGILTCKGFAVTANGVWTPGTGTVELIGLNTLPATILTSFNNLTISASTTTTGAALTINNNLLIVNGTGTTFTAAGFPLTVTGTTIVGSGTTGNSTLNFSSATGAKIFTGLVTIGTGGTWSNSTSNSPITFQGGITNNGIFTPGTGLQTFNTNDQVLSGTFSIPSIVVTGINLTNNNTLQITAALSGTGTLVQAIFAELDIDFTGASSITGITATAIGNLVDYEAAGAQTVFPTNYYNLTFSDDGIKTLQTATTSIGGDFDMSGTTTATAVVGLTIGGNVNIESGGSTFNSGTFTHTISGSLNNNGIVNAGVGVINVLTDFNNFDTFNGSPVSNLNIGGNVSNSGLFIANQDSILLNGSSVQTITNTGAGSIDNVAINNSGGGIQLESPLTTSTTLNMIQGNIDLFGSSLALGISTVQIGTLLRTSGTIINSNNGGGAFIRAFNTSPIPDGSIAGLFPVGNLTDYRPFSVSAPVVGPSTGGIIGVVYTDAAGTTPVSIPDAPDTIVVIENFNWALTTGGGLAGGTYDLDATGTGFGTISNVNDLRLSLASSVVGLPGVNGGTTANPQVNRINLALADLSNTFFVGSVDSTTSPLPITLISFNATPINGQVRLDWETASEFNNDYFTILRSASTVSWESLAVVQGSGNTSVDTKYSTYDASPLPGISYYRLEQTDIDGHESYSNIVSVNMGQPTTTSIYPNPATDYIFITMVGSSKPEISLISSSGETMNVPILINANSVRLTVSNIPVGTYFINITQNGVTQTRSVIKQ